MKGTPQFDALRAANPEISEDNLLAAITVDWSSIPPYAKERLVASAYNAFTEFMSQPDALDILEDTKARMRKEGSTLF